MTGTATHPYNADRKEIFSRGFKEQSALLDLGRLGRLLRSGGRAVVRVLGQELPSSLQQFPPEVLVLGLEGHPAGESNSALKMRPI